MPPDALISAQNEPKCWIQGALRPKKRRECVQFVSIFGVEAPDKNYCQLMLASAVHKVVKYYRRSKQSSNKIRILETKLEFGENEFNIAR